MLLLRNMVGPGEVDEELEEEVREDLGYRGSGQRGLGFYLGEKGEVVCCFDTCVGPAQHGRAWGGG